MVPYVAFRHNEPGCFYLLQIIGMKGRFPVSGNIAAFHNQVLPVFNGSLDDFTKGSSPLYVLTEYYTAPAVDFPP